MRSTNFSVVTLSLLALLAACSAEDGGTANLPPGNGNLNNPPLNEPTPGLGENAGNNSSRA